ncbi:hypothetical protein [Pelagicoccus sp. SDUM812002]|uniref:hypothetical protein n=1 Tax=Pelagicoccus sp. SDUM812002 TaxID=3041266 RepID=UPI00280E6A4F|nr:hypothetical protein [Pelagicoccus sp. SDUM812002]MDQ8184660.1 hypothetical protein [Pelagicoccus sp. SDUM812002]
MTKTATTPGAPGMYELRLVQFPHPMGVDSNDEYGQRDNGGSRTGIIETGDIDFFVFTLESVSKFVLNLSEIIETGQSETPFRPSLRLYDSDGTQLLDLVNDTAVEVERSNYAAGTYFLLVSDGTEKNPGPYSLNLIHFPVTIETATVHSIYGSSETIVEITAVDPENPAKQTVLAIQDAPTGMTLETISPSTAQIKGTPSDDQIPSTRERLPPRIRI